MDAVQELIQGLTNASIPFRPIAGVFEALDTLLKNDKDQGIRIAILQGMNTKLEEETLVLECAQWVLENDPSETVRSYAKQIVDAVAPAENN
jgi:hypothetical protein